MPNPLAGSDGPPPPGLQQLAEALSRTGYPPMPDCVPERLRPLFSAFVQASFQQRPDLARLEERLPEALDVLEAARAGSVPGLDAQQVGTWILLTLENDYVSGTAAPQLRRLLDLLLDGAPPGALPPVVQRMALRQAFREGLWAEGLCASPPVSLGDQCFPWTFAGRWGFLADAKVAHRAFNPFSLAQHSADYVTDRLDRGWGDYAAPDALAQVRSPNGQVVIHRRDGRAWWNHHTNAEWRTPGWEAFRANIGLLAAQLDSLLAAPPWRPMVFHHTRLRDMEDAALESAAERLVGALRRRMPGHRPRLFLNCLTRSLPGARAWQPSADVVIHRRLLPAPDYDWFARHCYNGAAGFALERGIAQALRDAMLRWRAQEAG